MWKNFAICISLLCALAGCAGVSEAKRGQGVPEAALEPHVVEFNLKRSIDRLPRSTSAVLHNRGADVLEIKGHKSTCGCVDVTFSADRVAPGESADMEVALNPLYFGGDTSSTIAIETNDPNQPLLTFTISSKWEEPYWIDPVGGTIELGTLERNQTATIEAKFVQQFGENPLEVLSVETTSPKVTATLDDAPDLEGRPGRAVHIAYAADNTAGPVQEKVIVKTNQPREAEDVVFHLRGQVASDYHIQPGRIFFSGLRPGATRTRRIRIEAKDPARRELPEVRVSSPGVKAWFESEALPAELQVAFSTDAPEGELSEYVELVEPSGEATRIAVQAKVVVPPT